MPALDLALRLGVIGAAADMIHTIFFEVFGQAASDVAGAVVAQQPGLCSTVTLSHPDAARAISSVALTSSAFMVVHSFQPTM